VFAGVPNPYGVQDELSEHRATVLGQAKASDEQRTRDEIVQYLDVYHERLSQTNARNQPDVGYAPPVYPPQQQAPPNPPPPDREGPRPPRVPRTRS
jgi:hypothetical protein